MDKQVVDISSYSFDEFVAFLFARDVQLKEEQADPKKWDPWYSHVEVTCDAQRTCQYYVRLFRQPAFLLERFSRAQLEEAFWGIQAANLDCSASRIVLDSDLPFAAKEECVRSMFDLFQHLFSVDPLESSAQMWWDSLCYDWTIGWRENRGEDLMLQNVMFETLAKTLDLDSEPCQRAALHGLGHLRHPDTEELIQHFIDRHPQLSAEQRAYALAAAKFEVQ
jgi:hypothetical protein